MIDEANNGSPSLVEANWRGPARLYRTIQKNRNHWLGFRLVGTRSNRDAVGASVSVRQHGRTMTREVEPANGFLSQRDPRLLFGLGDAPAVETVTVRWPTGRTHTAKVSLLDRYYTIVEP